MREQTFSYNANIHVSNNIDGSNNMMISSLQQYDDSNNIMIATILMIAKILGLQQY